MPHFLLIRHATYDGLARTLTGRTAGAHLNEEGMQQAATLAERLAPLPLAALYSSPLERALETAAPIARRQGLPVQVMAEAGEIDFGVWAGQAFEELDASPHWQRWNLFRSGTCPPGGEWMLGAQLRIVSRLGELCAAEPGGLVAIVSHSDLIKAALAHYLGVPLDLFQRIEISPASVSVVALQDAGPRVLCINDTGALSTLLRGR